MQGKYLDQQLLIMISSEEYERESSQNFLFAFLNCLTMHMLQFLTLLSDKKTNNYQ